MSTGLNIHTVVKIEIQEPRLLIDIGGFTRKFVFTTQGGETVEVIAFADTEEALAIPAQS